MLKQCQTAPRFSQCSKADQMEALTQETFARTCDTPVDFVTYCTLGAQITIEKDALCLLVDLRQQPRRAVSLREVRTIKNVLMIPEQRELLRFMASLTKL